MQGQVGGGIADEVLVVFRVVAPQEGERALTQVAVDVAHFLRAFRSPRITTLFFRVLRRKLVVCPMKPLMTPTWFWVSMVGTGSYLAANSNRVK